jgi:hypothetical protein
MRRALSFAIAVTWGLSATAARAQTDDDWAPASQPSMNPSAEPPEAGGQGPSREAEEPKIHLEVYGFAWFAGGYDFNRVDPAWFDVERPTKIAATPGEFGANGETFFSVRPSRFGTKGELPTGLGTLKTIFEFELFGTGVDAGQTTFRLRHFYGEIGQFGAGQYWSPFMDPDVFPNSLEYWGPNAMVFFRNIQVRWMPIQGDTRLTFALERPGASADLGEFADNPNIMQTTPRFPVPDLTGEFRYGGGWGYVKLSGILRRINWDQVNATTVNLTGAATGWGVNLSSNLKLGDLVTFKLQGVYGKAIQNYMNDAGPDVGIVNNPGNPAQPLLGTALSCLGLMGFADINWSKEFASSVGYSFVHVGNSNGEPATALHMGHYALANFLWTPVPDVMTGIEFQWGRRVNAFDGFSANDFRLQLTAKFAFSASMGKPIEK